MKTIFQGKVLTIPNILSFLRICMIPWFLTVYLKNEDSTATAMILLLSGFTDLIDGLIARRFNMISNLGKILDPIADKLTQIAIIACLVFRFPRMWLVLIIFCVKELFVVITGLMRMRKTEEVSSASWHGKLTTFMLNITVISHLLFPDISDNLSIGLIGLCIGCILFSGISYGIRNLNTLRTGKENSASE